jgi:2-hydroxychromene-2-carboxylate isomerase
VQPVFHYDLGSPESYLAAERVMAALPVVPEWTPIYAAALPAGAAAVRDLDPSCAVPERAPPPMSAGRDAGLADRRAAVERAAAALHVQPLRWPAGWPGETRAAMVAATYAKQIGRAVAFSLAAFRQAFAGGRELADEDTILIAAAACEMHPRAVRQALGRASVAAALDAATAAAGAAGVRDVPALVVGDQVFQGADCVEVAAAALATAPAPAP